MNKFIEFLLGFPKSIYVNFKYLSFGDAIKFPILISKNVKLIATKGKVSIEGSLYFGEIKVGFGDVGIFDRKLSKSIWQVWGGSGI